MNNKKIGIVYLILALVGIWFLTKLWIPSGFVVAGHDSGLALDSGSFLSTRLNAWDGRINFGVDNSPHFGSLVMHSFDYLLSLIAGTVYAGDQLAVFFWISVIFVSAYIFSSTIESVVGKYFKYIFPVIVTFNFYIFQSIFILERAKYELFSALLIFLALAFKVLTERKKSIIKYSIIFSVLLSIFNGGGWFGLPLYGGLLVTGVFLFIFVLFLSFKKKKFDGFKKLTYFYLLSFIFFALLNTYSILPFLSTLKTYGYEQVVDEGVIRAGKEWLNYVSRGSSFMNLFKFQGVPDWYLSEFSTSTGHAYAELYLNNSWFVLLSFAFPLLAFSSLFFAKRKKEMYLVSFASILLLVSMFFSAGTNSPLGFIYDFVYNKLPGFSIFRSPYYKFGYVYIASFGFLMAYSLSKLIELTKTKFKKTSALVLLVVLGWFAFHFVIFDPGKVFSWQKDRSTLVQIPQYVNDFGKWIEDNKALNGKILLLPSMESPWMAESYSWGYWSLSTLPSVTFSEVDFVTNDTNLKGGEGVWVERLYSLLRESNIPAFKKLASKLGIKYLLLRKDFVSSISATYVDTVSVLYQKGELILIGDFDQWSLFEIPSMSVRPIVYPSNNLIKVSESHFYISKDLANIDDSDYSWIKFEEVETVDEKIDGLTKKEFYNLPCQSCHIENLGKYAQRLFDRVLPNSPFYIFKKIAQNKMIDEARDDTSKLNVYLNFTLVKLSEIQMMIDINIDKRSIASALEDMYDYMAEVDSLLEGSEEMRNNFYFTSRAYEILNPVQKYFRSFVSRDSFQFEEEGIRNGTMKVLWEAIAIKKRFDPLVSQSDLWSYEKLYRLDGLQEGRYKLIIDKETLPVDEFGSPLMPQAIVNTGQKIGVKQTDSPKWFETSYFTKTQDVNEIRLSFSKPQNKYFFKERNQVDFPEGQKGCLVGGISFFNKYKAYRVVVSSSVGRENLKLYVKGNVSSTEEFLRADVLTNVLLSNPNYPFEYIYVPEQIADSPSIYLCGNDPGIPFTEKVEVYEISSPNVFAEKDTSSPKTNLPAIDFERINPSKYKVSAMGTEEPFVLVFSQRFSPLWRLTDVDGQSVGKHLSIDGYANGWVLGGKEKYELILEYYPQRYFRYGARVTVVSLVTIVVGYVFISRKKKNETN